ncbi:hypothetical protein ATZ33_02310 [Enterococcus silesiacus]|uniref:Uncharacterized protein n=1 Tax=Enterococcus silesiacus TaxID=332949 RepID=A0A0S3K7I9_9ENTE|nr:hypothetical protein [Enterococcus silesiacus]ALS00250.1 hypothetical protein ATZ33_02310 [Enterococcus silesiacus]OJG93232.1 hypothetical protein RV15_GL001264 [Enterococcus silesiacus]
MIKTLFKVSVAVLGFDVSIIIIPLVIVRFFPGSAFDQVGWIFPLWGVLILPFAFLFFLLSFYFYNKKNRLIENELDTLKRAQEEEKL